MSVLLHQELPFAFACDAHFFELEKAAAQPGQRRRVAGAATDEDEDQDEETVLQDGIDWSYFLRRGFINENHDKTISGIVGYPARIERFQKGAELPDRTTARSNLTWVEGFLLENDTRADAIWQKGLALQGTPRALGFSVEGKSRLRSDDGSTVIKSMVRHLAITHQAVNPNTRANFLLKSLARVREASPDTLEKAWRDFGLSFREGRATKTEAIAHVRDRVPGISNEQARRVVEVLLERRRRTT